MATGTGKRLNTDHKRKGPRRPARTLAAAAKAPARRSQLTRVKPSRADQSAFRRDAILAAALEEFSARGFAAARLEDVAQRAGVGKGTIYLHFRDKEALFQELVTSMLGPFVANLEATPPTGLPIRLVLQRLVDVFLREIYGTERRKLLRLVMTEGPRFPQLAEFHYENVVKRAIAAMRALLTAAHARGELRNDALVRFPQLVVAPAMMSIIWSGLFDRFATLDVAALMAAHLDLILDTGLSTGEAS
jgi:AcrR family transcriptional regulator